MLKSYFTVINWISSTIQSDTNHFLLFLWKWKFGFLVTLGSCKLCGNMKYVFIVDASEKQNTVYSMQSSFNSVYCKFKVCISVLLSTRQCGSFLSMSKECCTAGGCFSQGHSWGQVLQQCVYICTAASYHHVAEQEHPQLQTVDWPPITVCFVLPCQAAAALKELYKKHPVLYNSSIVCSFEPKVIYRVSGCWNWVIIVVFDWETAMEQNGAVYKCVNIVIGLACMCFIIKPNHRVWLKNVNKSQSASLKSWVNWTSIGDLQGHKMADFFKARKTSVFF